MLGRLALDRRHPAEAAAWLEPAARFGDAIPPRQAQAQRVQGVGQGALGLGLPGRDRIAKPRRGLEPGGGFGGMPAIQREAAEHRARGRFGRVAGEGGLSEGGGLRGPVLAQGGEGQGAARGGEVRGKVGGVAEAGQGAGLVAHQLQGEARPMEAGGEIGGDLQRAAPGGQRLGAAALAQQVLGGVGERRDGRGRRDGSSGLGSGLGHGHGGSPPAPDDAGGLSSARSQARIVEARVGFCVESVVWVSVDALVGSVRSVGSV